MSSAQHEPPANSTAGDSTGPISGTGTETPLPPTGSAEPVAPVAVDVPLPEGLPTAPQPGTAGLPFEPPRALRYKVRRNLLENRWLRIALVVIAFAACGAAILNMVHTQTGTAGFVVGVALAVLPVPLVLGAYHWLDRVEPKPARLLLFCFGWGACAATLVAILANDWATSLLISHQVGGGETLGASLVAPLVEESSKAAPLLLIFLFRRRDFTGIVDGAVYAGFTATGFAFTENILYIGRSVMDGSNDGGTGIAATVMTFVMREVMSPFAHPLFTSMTAVGFGLAAISRKRWQRICAPIAGWIFAMLMHGTWNSAPVLGPLGFFGVYFLFMMPVFALMVWLVIWSRGNELRVVGKQLAVYVAAGWIARPVPLVLASMRTRKQARALARFQRGPTGDKAMREYQGFATSLALLRERVARGLAVQDFAEREQELLHHLWERKETVEGVFDRVGEQEWYRTHPPLATAWAGAPTPGFGYPYPQRPGYTPYPQRPGPGYAPYPHTQPPGYGQQPFVPQQQTPPQYGRPPYAAQQYGGQQYAPRAYAPQQPWPYAPQPQQPSPYAAQQPPQQPAVPSQAQPSPAAEQPPAES
ncbi:PrsW family glutamic-type intramembrane protease [Streptacidiphilus sp. MAP5-3]|uniref:PrsW family intramembrane metalloprotease n=1 Tax=unclassified Streptacidiphilus TaxID=2643834 RepID=UPI00351818DB